MSTIIAFNITTETFNIYNKTLNVPAVEDDGDDSLQFIFVPLAVLLGIMALSALVYLMARNRRKLVKMYKLVQTPNSAQKNHWDIEDNDDPTECLLTGKLQINNHYNKYQTGCLNGRSELYT